MRARTRPVTAMYVNVCRGGDLDGERRRDHDGFFVVHDEVADVGDEHLACLGSQETAFWIIRVTGHVVQVVHLVGIFSC